MDYKFFEVMSELFDENKAFKNVETIYNYEKWISYDKYCEASAFCRDKMAEIGLCELERKEILADGETFYGDWRVPKSWCAKSATLSLSTGEVLCDYEAIPCSLSMYSRPTVPEGIEAELVVIDDIKNVPCDIDLKGKLILVGCSSAGAVDLAKKSGAVGILCDAFPLFPGVRDSREEMRGVHRWDCMPNIGHSLFAFSLAPEQGDMLREKAKKEKLTLRAKVVSELSDIPLYVVSGAIKGTEPSYGEIILYGHLDEPGANDNASGCGAILELMRSLKEAIDSGRLKRPKYTIRAVMGPEYNGSVGYIHFHPERERLSLVVADMIGNEEKDRAHINIKHNPLSNRSYTDAAIMLSNRRYDEFSGGYHYVEQAYYNPGSDNFVADPSLNTPSVAMGNFPAQSYHSSADTMERIEADILKRNALIVGDCVYMLAVADANICQELKAELIVQGEELLKDASDRRRASLCRESIARSLASLRRLVPDFDVETEYPIFREAMPAYAKAMGADRVPLRLVKGPLSMAKHPDIRDKYFGKYDAPTALQWTDGVRNIWDITINTALENFIYDDEGIKELLGVYLEMFEDLEKAGYCVVNS